MDPARDPPAGGADPAGIEFERRRDQPLLCCIVRGRRLRQARLPGGHRASVRVAASLRRDAIEALGNGERGESFADARGPREDQARRKGLPENRSRKQTDQLPMTDDIAECHSGLRHASYHSGF